MSSILYKDAVLNEDISIAYSDYGHGQPVLLIHGWPLSKEMWEYQLPDIISNGNRVIAYDRRGFGDSSKPWEGYGYDLLAADLNQLIGQLDLRDVILVGFSMGGGEIARYLKKYGRSRIARVVLISSILPFLQKTAENSSGVEADVFKEMVLKIKTDRMLFLEEFLKQFFDVSVLNRPVSHPMLNYYLGLASKAAMHATISCITSFSATDFSNDLDALEELPLLLIHGDEDRIVPKEASTDLLAGTVAQAQYSVYADAPHGLFYTHRGRLNRDLINFIKGMPYQKMDEELMPPVIPPFLF
ncbi:alpha/beta fold hydrolase [Niabella soli]|uniref:Arylesterase n=1 Tax=Niabella soli DSM 19437 TaxID=929713 RepID=W0EXM8_9BACT|nr:alpha/beta hydrolase [Niabella soli]AHF14308.1 arylesterase [Niabella soli DSM 19437]